MADGVAVEVFDEAHVAEGAGAVVEEGQFEFEKVFGAGVFDAVPAVALPAGGRRRSPAPQQQQDQGDPLLGGVDHQEGRAGLQCHIS